jgi:hypothetical protein
MYRLLQNIKYMHVVIKLLVTFTITNRQFAAEAIDYLLSTTKFTVAPSLSYSNVTPFISLKIRAPLRAAYPK